MSNEGAIAEFENLKATIEELKIKRLSDIREKERLEGELEKLEQEVKNVYGVELGDFKQAIADLEAELESKLAKLKELIEKCHGQIHNL